MLNYVIEKQKTPKFIATILLFFILFLGLYSIIDSLNLSYEEMAVEFGLYLPILNIVINIIMAGISALMISFTSAQFDLSGKESQGSNLSFLSILFGILTYGCTPCVISFFAAVGISFSVVALPLAGLPYKLVSLLLVILGFLWVLYSIKHSVCKVPLGTEK